MKYIILTLWIALSIQTFGQLNWENDFGGNSEDLLSKIEIDNEGNIIAIGSFEGVVDFDGPNSIGGFISNGSRDIYIMKSDPLGTVMWVKTIGSSNYEDPYGLAIDQNNNIVVTGRFFSSTDFDPGPEIFNLSSNGATDCFVLMLDANGDFVWAESIGGGNIEVGLDAVFDSQNNLFIMGNYTSWEVDFDPGIGTQILSGDGIGYTFLLKLTSSGQFIWVKSYAATNHFNAQDLVISGDTALVLSGGYSGDLSLQINGTIQNFSSQNNALDMFVMKVNELGEPKWFYELNGKGMYQDVSAIDIDNFGNIYAGSYYRDSLYFEMDNLPYSLYSSSYRNALMFSLNSSGEMLWYNAVSSDGLSSITSIDTQDNGKTYFTGFFSGSIPIFGIGTFNSVNSGDIMIGSIMPGGGYFQDFMTIGSTESASGFAIKLNNANEVYTGGIFKGQCQFAMASGNYVWQSNGNFDSYLIGLGQTLGISELNPLEVSIYPNPTDGKLIIDGLNKLNGIKDIIVTDLLGIVIETSMNVSNNHDFTLDNPGVYLVNIYADNKFIITCKVIKQ